MIGGNKKGFTLMELMVYMAILGVIVLVAGEAFSNSTKFRVRTGNMIKATQEAENVAMLLKEDLSQMGAKSSLENVVAGGTDVFSTAYVNEVYMDPNNVDLAKQDSSSYKIVNSDGHLDSLIFRRLRYDDDGKFQAVEEVAWILKGEEGDRTLSRQCVILEKAAGVDDEPCAPKGTSGDAMEDYVVTMATGVSNFEVLPGIPFVRSNASLAAYQTEQIFPPGGGDQFRLFSRYGEANFNIITTSAGGNSVSLSGFMTNYNMETETPITEGKVQQQVIVLQNTDDAADSWTSLCAIEGNNFTFNPHEEYELSFSVPFPNTGDVDDMQMFVPGRDHMAVGFVTLAGKKPATMEDFLFYPPSSKDGGSVERSMRFTVPDTVKRVCMAFTFAIYSPVVAKGTLTIKNLKLKRVASSNYNFAKTDLEYIDKKNVKAFKVKLQVSRGAKNDGAGETGNVDIVIPAPSNGPRD